MTNGTDPESRRTRQRTTITVISIALIVAGLVVLFVLQRLPLPMRILVGLTDIVAGATLLILVRQTRR